MKKEDLVDCIDKLHDVGKKLLTLWNDYSMQQIRLESANKKRLQEQRFHYQESIEEKRNDYKRR